MKLRTARLASPGKAAPAYLPTTSTTFLRVSTTSLLIAARVLEAEAVIATAVELEAAEEEAVAAKCAR